MSSQITNNYMTEPTSLNPYITRKLNNMDKAKKFKKEWDNLTRLYHKTLKGLEAMIDIQRQIQEIMKIVEEINTTIMEMEETILKTSINNRMINAINILEISEYLRYLIQSNIKDLLQSIPQWCIMEKGKGYDDTIGCTVVVSVSTSCSRCYNLALSLRSPHVI